ncbi:hypothetical protein D6C82_04387 [Aureobasidium pullulans]|nr:hypothetical protein D6C82_04387 [Aureobasidium pullulans]
MKSAIKSLALVLLTARTSQAVFFANGTVTVTSMLPTITISSCPLAGTAPPGVVPVEHSAVTSTRTYTTVLTQPCPSGFVPVTYTFAVVDQTTGIPSGFTTGVMVVNSRTETVPYPTASASDYVQSGYIAPSASGAILDNGRPESGSAEPQTHSSVASGSSPTLDSVTAVATLGVSASGKTLDDSESGAASVEPQTHSSVVSGPSTASRSSATVLTAGTASGVGSPDVGNSSTGIPGVGGSPSALPKGPSNSTVPASTSSIAVYTGGVSAGPVIDSTVFAMIVLLLGKAFLM